MNNSMKTPLIRLAKREGMDKRTVWAIRVGSILLALLLGALVIAISGVNPFKAYGTIITGALGKKTAIRQTVKIAVIGDSLNTARYAGMNVGHVMMRTMFLSGAISGLVGFIVASGANNTLYDGVANGVGFTSITVAWLSQLNAFAMIVISALLAILEKGAETLQTAMQVPTSISDIVTGILLFCMLGCEFFINYRMIFRRKQAEAPAAPAAAESDQTESKEDASC